MHGKRLENVHPYGLHVATGGGSASPATREAADRAGKKADRLLDKLVDEAPAGRNGAQRPARRSSPKT